MPSRVKLISVVLATACGSAWSLGVDAAPPPGRLLASQCAQCHGTNGNGPGFDELAGKPAQETYNELLEMKRRAQVEGIMDRHARGYSDAQLRLIAEYFATLSPAGGGN